LRTTGKILKKEAELREADIGRRVQPRLPLGYGKPFLFCARDPSSGLYTVVGLPFEEDTRNSATREFVDVLLDAAQESRARFLAEGFDATTMWVDADHIDMFLARLRLSAALGGDTPRASLLPSTAPDEDDEDPREDALDSDEDDPMNPRAAGTSESGSHDSDDDDVASDMSGSPERSRALRALQDEAALSPRRLVLSSTTGARDTDPKPHRPSQVVDDDDDVLPTRFRRFAGASSEAALQETINKALAPEQAEEDDDDPLGLAGLNG
jgi:hypothetical protein